MAHPDDESGEATEEQRTGMEVRLADQDRTLAAMHALEEALGHPAPGRERHWIDRVADALAGLDAAVAEEDANAERPDSLWSDMRRSQPRLRSQAHGVRVQYRHLRDRIAALRAELEERDRGEGVDYPDVRQRLTWLLTALRYQRARESDLIYEAYFDVFGVDLADEPDTDT